MFPCMCKAPALFLIIRNLPVQASARSGSFEGRMEKDQQIRLRNDLPHAWDVGMFLGNVPAAIPMDLQPRDQRGLARATRPDHPNQRRGRITAHYRAEVIEAVPV